MDSGPTDLAQELEVSTIMSDPPTLPKSPISGGGLRKNLIGALLAGDLGIGAAFMSCVGQSFCLRQARSLEDIAQTLKEILASYVRGRQTPPPRKESP